MRLRAMSVATLCGAVLALASTSASTLTSEEVRSASGEPMETAVETTGEPRWIAVYGGTAQNLRGVHFASPSYGWIAGENLTILRSETGGASWVPAALRTDWPMAAADCCLTVSTRALPSPEAWLAGPNKVVRYGSASTMSGMYSYGAVVLSAVFPIPATGTTWYGGSTATVGGSLRLYRKTSSSTLTVMFFTGGNVQGISFANEDNGWAVATSGRIVSIRNGTASDPDIDVSSGPTSANLNGICMLDQDRGWIVGDRGTILRTTNGTSWSSRPSGTVNDLRDVAFRDAEHGLIVGDAGLVLVTSDGGSTWKVEASGTSSDLYGAAWCGNTAFAVGDAGTILMRTEAGSARRRAVRR